MARRVDIDAADLDRLLSSLRYASVKVFDLDPALSEYLRVELNEVLEHLGNEHYGSEVGSEIEVVLAFIGGKGVTSGDIQNRVGGRVGVGIEDESRSIRSANCPGHVAHRSVLGDPICIPAFGGKSEED